MMSNETFTPGTVLTNFINRGFLYGKFESSSDVYPVLIIQRMDTMGMEGYLIDLYDDENCGDCYYKIRLYRESVTREVYWFLYPTEEGDSKIGPFETFYDAAQSIDAMIADTIDDIECVWDNCYIESNEVNIQTPSRSTPSIEFDKTLQSRLARIRRNKNS
jgi:hypothetical protein